MFKVYTPTTHKKYLSLNTVTKTITFSSTKSNAYRYFDYHLTVTDNEIILKAYYLNTDIIFEDVSASNPEHDSLVHRFGYVGVAKKSWLFPIKYNYVIERGVYTEIESYAIEKKQYTEIKITSSVYSIIEEK